MDFKLHSILIFSRRNGELAAVVYFGVDVGRLGCGVVSSSFLFYKQWNTIRFFVLMFWLAAAFAKLI